MNEIFKAYITKYALTKGITTIKKAKVWKDSEMLEDLNNPYVHYHREGGEWHRTYEQAVKKANELKEKKIKNLEKQLQKFKNLAF